MCEDLGMRSQRLAPGINNRARHGRESEGAIVAMKRGNSRGAKGPCRIDVSVRRKEYRLGIPTTELCSEPRQGLGPGPSSLGRLSRCQI